MKYRITHTKGDAGFERDTDVTENDLGYEAPDARTALADYLPREAMDWPITDTGDGRAIANNPEYDWKGCRYSDYYEAEPLGWGLDSEDAATDDQEAADAE